MRGTSTQPVLALALTQRPRRPPPPAASPSAPGASAAALSVCSDAPATVPRTAETPKGGAERAWLGWPLALGRAWAAGAGVLPESAEGHRSSAHCPS